MKHKHVLTIIAVIALAAACASAFAQAGAGAAAGAAQKLLAAAASAPPAIAISGNFVYVVQGRVLYQFSVDGLKLIAQAQLGPNPRELLRGAAARRGRKAGKGGLPAPDAGNPNPAPAGGNAPAGNPPAAGDAPTVVAPPAGAPK